MAAFLRFLWVLLFKPDNQPTHQALDTVVTRHRVGYSDIDLNLHLNNARYLSFMDRARLEHSISTGLFRLFRARANFLVANLEISFIRSLLPRQRFEIATRLLCWDERYYYVEHVFQSEGTVYAKAYARMVFMENGKRVLPAELLKRHTGFAGESPLAPPVIAHWQTMLAAKRWDGTQESRDRRAA